MKFSWKTVFFLLPWVYMLLYAPFGINESDGGFITGLAWQVLSGKTLYADLVYVRPPMSIWLRVLELRLFPENWAILAERGVFYLKVALYTYCAASMLTTRERKWMLASFGYVISVHCYPAAAWHTVDGILFGVLSFWSLLGAKNAKVPGIYLIFSAVCLVASALCKQSFYPLLVLWPLCLILLFTWKQILTGLGTMVLAFALFVGYLMQQGTLNGFLTLTSGATGSGQAIQHGILDYLDVNPLLCLPFLVLIGLLLLVNGRRVASNISIQSRVWLQMSLVGALLIILPATYVLTIWKNQVFTIPFAQSRLLFDLAVIWGCWSWYQQKWTLMVAARFFSLLGISWCAAMSWGYSLPILCAVPWVYAAIAFCRSLLSQNDSSSVWVRRFGPIYFCLLLGVFGYAYTFIYSDGKRSEMHSDLGKVFPKLSGIYTSEAHAALYQDLKETVARFGPRVKTLPNFTLANYLTNTNPPLPLDWVVQRELSDKYLSDSILQQEQLVFLIQKAQLAAIQIDPEMKFTRNVLEKGNIIAETAHFLVVRTNHE
jgi:hypothetical protein